MKWGKDKDANSFILGDSNSNKEKDLIGLSHINIDDMHFDDGLKNYKSSTPSIIER